MHCMIIQAFWSLALVNSVSTQPRMAKISRRLQKLAVYLMQIRQVVGNSLSYLRALQKPKKLSNRLLVPFFPLQRVSSNHGSIIAWNLWSWVRKEAKTSKNPKWKVWNFPGDPSLGFSSPNMMMAPQYAHLVRSGSYIFSDSGSTRLFSDASSVRSLASIGMGSTDGKKMMIRKVPNTPSELLSYISPPTWVYTDLASIKQANIFQLCFEMSKQIN